MADRDIHVITPADEQDLLTLDECKLFLNIAATDTSRDAQLALQISTASAIVADMANRKPELGFGKTTVTEEWREVMNNRTQVMHFPIDKDEQLEIISNGTLLTSGVHYRVDFNSGKITLYSWAEPTILTYTGGFDLPDDAPLPLKKACSLIVQEDRIKNQQAQVAGMRQLRHKEALVSFYDPNALLLKATGAKSAGIQAAESLIRPYIRIEV